MRALVALVVLAALAAGCTSGERAQTASLALGAVSGTVTTPSAEPIAGALVTVDGQNASATTDASGAFRIVLPLGEHLLLASAPGHRGEALRARIAVADEARLAFVLPRLPTEAPSVEVSEAHGLLSCALMAKAAESGTGAACGRQDPNERARLAFPAPALAGLTSVVIEVAWEPTTLASKVLLVTVTAGEGEAAQVLAQSEGMEHVAILLPARILAEGLAPGQDLVVTIEPAGSLTDEEAAIDAGLALQQPFAVYASVFRHAPAPAGYRVAS